MTVFFIIFHYIRGKIMGKDLSPRQQELFIMLLKGISPKEIAINLNIAYNTLLYHQKKLYCKLGVHNIQELMAKYSHEIKYDQVGGVDVEPETITVRKSVLFGTFGVLIAILIAIIFFLSFLSYNT
jgi:DNA-binding CsgD family transcriptional regulator